ncbi:exonuclease domain-containing protein [Bacillus mesophilum]|uniref:3'-5' exonuclease n=1 Tax=Bacillus mesophilum TaxID=1071718 RepID=A0A7V7RPN1_9BACI|nr:exonuclease domain-containing protein [Bacillus mesophilum]KAB2335158.1 3'-5' exonuclease [Bacillus mesophilum]
MVNEPWKMIRNLFGGLSKENSQHLAYMRQLQREIAANDIMNMPLRRLNAVVFDIETTGFYPEKGDQILSIGAVKIQNGELLENESFYTLIHTSKTLSDEIALLTGIKQEHLADAPMITDALMQFFKYVKDLPLIAHHSSHEKKFMQQVCWANFKTPFRHRLFDTSFLYRLVEQEERSIKLEDCCKRHGIEVYNRHHALGDAILTAKLWLKYCQDVETLGCQNMNDVYEMLAKK